MCCRFPNRGVQNGQAAGRRTRAHRCRHRGRVCGHAGSARADGVKNKPWFVVGLDLRNTVRKQLSCGSCLSERGRCFFNIGTKFLQSFVFFKCGGSKARPNIIETASPSFQMRRSQKKIFLPEKPSAKVAEGFLNLNVCRRFRECLPRQKDAACSGDSADMQPVKFHGART